MDIKDLELLIKETKKLKVLYVEDHEETRKQSLKIFSNFFTEVDIAIDGLDALRKYKVNCSDYDLVITDINMPFMNGIELSKAIFELNNQQKILVVSAYNDSEDQLQKIIELGIKNYINKPVKLERLVEELVKFIYVR